MLSDKALQDFKRIFREEKGAELSDEEAIEEAIALLTFYDTVYRPIKKEWLEQYFQAHPEELNDYGSDRKHS
ncbi:MAG: hypothetical protein HZB11_01880 [Candidatus Yonathbacteria bacterium]|nr:hypothetical protein [Candidatus Yonathbacteria bacterium]